MASTSVLLQAVFLCTPSLSVTYMTIPTPQQVLGNWTGIGDDEKSPVKCPTSNPTLTSCEILSQGNDPNIDGSFVSNSTCVAQNGGGNLFVRSAALCQSSDYDCFHVSGPADDVDTSVYCDNSDYRMVSCRAYSPWRSIAGMYIGQRETDGLITADTQCTAVNDGGIPVGGVYAYGTCCKYVADDAYSLDCMTKWDENGASSGVSSVSCDEGYTIMGCSGISSYADTLNAWYYDQSTNLCQARSVTEFSVKAVATCCRLKLNPTQKPTEAPSPTAGVYLCTASICCVCESCV